MEDKSLTTGAIVGIILASLVFILLVISVSIVIICRRRRERPKPSNGSDTPNTTTSEISTISGATYTAVNGSRHHLHRGGDINLDHSFQDTMELDPNESFVPPAVVQPPPYSPGDYGTGSRRGSARVSRHFTPQRNSMMETMPVDEPPPPYDRAVTDTVVTPPTRAERQRSTDTNTSNLSLSPMESSMSSEPLSSAAPPRRNNLSHSSLPSRRPRSENIRNINTGQPQRPGSTQNGRHHQQQRSNDLPATYHPHNHGNPIPLQTLPPNGRSVVQRPMMDSTPTHGRNGTIRTVPNTNPYLHAMRSGSNLRNLSSSNASQCSSNSSRTQSPANLIDDRQHIPLTYTHRPTPIHPTSYTAHTPNHIPASHLSPTRILTTLPSRSPQLLLVPRQRQMEHDRNMYNSSTDNSQEPIYAEPGDVSTESGISYGNENEPIYASVDDEHMMPSYLTGSNV